MRGVVRHKEMGGKRRTTTQYPSTKQRRLDAAGDAVRDGGAAAKVPADLVPPLAPVQGALQPPLLASARAVLSSRPPSLRRLRCAGLRQGRGWPQLACAHAREARRLRTCAPAHRRLRTGACAPRLCSGRRASSAMPHIHPCAAALAATKARHVLQHAGESNGASVRRASLRRAASVLGPLG